MRKLSSMLVAAWRWFIMFVDRIYAYRHDGLLDMAPLRNWRVVYPDGARSIRMPYGNCLDYQEIFGGRIVPAFKWNGG